MLVLLLMKMLLIEGTMSYVRYNRYHVQTETASVSPLLMHPTPIPCSPIIKNENRHARMLTAQPI